jgi:hypothetical protein
MLQRKCCYPSAVSAFKEMPTAGPSCHPFANARTGTPLDVEHELQFGEIWGPLRTGVRKRNGGSIGEPPGGAPTDAPSASPAAVEVPPPASAIEEVPSGLTTPASSPKPSV